MAKDGSHCLPQISKTARMWHMVIKFNRNFALLVLFSHSVYFQWPPYDLPGVVKIT